jgi:hypothetical protein
MMNELKKVEMNSGALLPDCKYLWERNTGELTPVWLNDEKDGINSYDTFNAIDTWYFDAGPQGLSGQLYGPFTLAV